MGVHIWLFIIGKGRPQSVVVTYLPHLSPLPHSHVVCISFIKRLWSTLRLERSFSFISATAMAQ